MPLSSLTSPVVAARLWTDLQPLPQGLVTQLAGEEITINAPSATYAGMGNIRGYREWQGERMEQTLTATPFVIANKKYENSLTVWGDDIRYNSFGMVERRIQQLRVHHDNHWLELATAALLVGTSNVGYDGINFFSASHVEGSSGTQSNLLTHAAATGTIPTVQEFIDSLMEAVQAMSGYKNEHGSPMTYGFGNFLVIVPVALIGVASAAVKSAFVADGAVISQNMLTGIPGLSFEVVPNPLLTTASQYYVLRGDGMAFIRQTVPGMPKIHVQAEGSVLEYKEDRHAYGIMTIRGIGYGSWQSVVRMAFT